ncbi:MAG: hypothetical protein OEV31_03810 [Gammaproteobacteria bacterium]|nr:hypothetical protein [Gammaproteobacteria bacterium]
MAVVPRELCALCRMHANRYNAATAILPPSQHSEKTTARADMLFNSFEFIFFFLPVTLVVFFLLTRHRLPQIALA